MKRFVFISMIFMLLCVELYGLTGSAYLTPSKIARGSYGQTIEINYYPGAGLIWNSGSVAIIIPDAFPTPPTLTSGAPGELKISYLRSGTIIEPISQSNIIIDGRAITINAINFSSNDLLRIVYGTKDNGGPGVQSPYTSGVYYFYMYEKPLDASDFIMLDDPPKIKVTMLDINKSANVTSAMAKNTFTYIINYNNISNMYPVNGVRIWDTLPQGIKYISSNVTPVTQSGNYLLWNIGILNNNGNGLINIVVEAQTGIIDYGTRLTNTVKIQGGDGYGTYLEEAEVGIDIFGAKLEASIYATPSIIRLDEHLTVVMNVQNTGNYHAGNVSPTALTIFGSANAAKVSGPTPPYVPLLQQNAMTFFTWVYKATGAGSLYFNGRVLGQENTLLIESNTANSDVVNIIMPIITPAITLTQTPTKQITLTMTPTETQQEEITLTCTNTETSTPTPTPTLHITPTFTETQKPVIDTPTPFSTAVPTPTPDAFVYADKNYFNPEKGEKIKVHYKVLEQGVVDVKIYNLSGEVIISFSKNYSYSTYDYFYWDGKNNAGKIVGRGIYFIVVKQKSQVVMKKVVILK